MSQQEIDPHSAQPDFPRIDQRNSGSMQGAQQGIAGNYNTQIQQGDHSTVVLGRTQPERSRNEQILLDAVKEEVNDRLKQSLHHAVFIALRMEARPEQVDRRRPWDAEIKIGERPPEPLDQSATIEDVFDWEEINGRLLILGAPGSGKTTMMLDLAKVLVERTEQSLKHSLPVLFNLSSWKEDQQTIKDWLLLELKLKYGVRPKLGQQWIEQKKLLPLLDGLDELESGRQERCVERINEFLKSEDRPVQILVCSRLEEYNTYETKLELNGAICLQPLTNSQLEAYFAQVRQPRLWQAMQTDADLRELMQTPLWLSISILAADELNVGQWQLQDSLAMRREQLLDAYVQRMLHRNVDSKCYQKGKEPSARQTRYWLMVLARQLQERSQDEFLIEHMQPRQWLKTNQQKWHYRLIVGLSFGLTVGLGFGLIAGLSFGLSFGLTVGLLVGLGLSLAVGLLVGLNFGLLVGLETISTVEAFDLDFSRFARKDFFECLIVGLILSLTLGLLGGPLVGLIFGLSCSLIFGLLVGLKADIRTQVEPNQGIKLSFKNTIFSLAISLAAALVVKAFAWNILIAILGEDSGSRTATALPAALIVIISIMGGGDACGRHFALRYVLYRGGAIPWNYARFLNYCTDRLLLQRVGGRYRFIHKLLQEHFAAMPLEK